VSHANILLWWVSKRPDDQRALGLLREIGKARSAPRCLALRGQRPLGGEPGGVGEAAGGGDDGGSGIGSGNDGNISTTPLWRRLARPPYTAALSRSEDGRGPSLAPAAPGRELRA
jgi:hypothetical protein